MLVQRVESGWVVTNDNPGCPEVQPPLNNPAPSANHAQQKSTAQVTIAPRPPPPQEVSVVDAEAAFARVKTKTGISQLKKGILVVLCSNRLRLNAAQALTRKEMADLLVADVCSMFLLSLSGLKFILCLDSAEAAFANWHSPVCNCWS